MTRCSGFDAWRQEIECCQHIMKIVGVALYNFHWLQLFELGHPPNFILSLIAIAHKMPYIGDVTYIADFVADMGQVAKQRIKSQEGADVAEVNVIIDCWTAHIHSHIGWAKSFKQFFLAGKRVIKSEGLHSGVFSVLFIVRAKVQQGVCQSCVPPNLFGGIHAV